MTTPALLPVGLVTYSTKLELRESTLTMLQVACIIFKLVDVNYRESLPFSLRGPSTTDDFLIITFAELESAGVFQS